MSGGFNTPLPIGYRPVPSGTPLWGSEWKRATAKWYNHAFNLGASNAGLGGGNLDLQLLFDLTSSHPGNGIGAQVR